MSGMTTGAGRGDYKATFEQSLAVDAHFIALGDTPVITRYSVSRGRSFLMALPAEFGHVAWECLRER